ncbi:hypothetical protein CDV36_016355, partial [Fusarium kuroshium]
MDQDAISVEEKAAMDICSRCHAIDFDDIFGLDPSDLGSVPGSLAPLLDSREVADLDGRPQTWSKLCPICRLLATVVPTGQSDQSSYSLLARATTGWHEQRRNFDGDKMLADPTTIPTLVLQVLKKPATLFDAISANLYLFDQNSLGKSRGGAVAVTNSTHLDMQVLRSFLDHCYENHADSAICGIGHCPRGIELPSFRVIDVQAMRIVNPGPDPVYTALSYRWGKQAYDASFQPFDKSGELRDPSALPQLISDALKVTKDLGFRYCWVDRYCIPQDDPRAMQIQLGHMDDIFRLTTVTIVAVSDNDYLPGVSQKLNDVVQPVRVGKCNLAAASLRFDSMKHEIRWSPWSTRAWTYQERVFSRRRLFFTDAGVYYECGRMASGESGFSALQPRWNIDEFVNAPWVMSAGSFEREKKLLECLQTYSERNLTFAQDRLNAALGILHAFETTQQPLRHYLGTPILMVYKDHSIVSVPDVVSGLLWGMLFYNGTDGSPRCDAFPSWSWTGWTNQVYFLAKSNNRPISHPPDANMAVHLTSELKDGTLLTWDSEDSLRRLYGTPPSALSKFIHMDVLTVQIQLSMEGFEKSHVVHNPVEPYIVNIDSVEVELAEDKEFPFSEVRWKILDIPERGQIYVE